MAQPSRPTPRHASAAQQPAHAQQPAPAQQPTPAQQPAQAQQPARAQQPAHAQSANVQRGGTYTRVQPSAEPYVPGTVSDDVSDLDTAPRASAASGLSSGATMMSTGISSRTAQATRSASVRAGRNNRKRTETSRSSIVALVLVAIVVVGAVSFLLSRTIFAGNNGPTIAPGQEVKITIPDGAGGEEISTILMEAGVISDTASFFKEVRSQEAEMSLQSGTYEFITGANVKEVVKQLAMGPNSTADSITVPEGYTVMQIGNLCAEKLMLDYDEFMERAKASNYVNDYPVLLNVADDSLEGYLFPKTYDFGGKETSVDSAIRTMLTQFQIEVSSLDFEAGVSELNKRYGLDMTPYKVIIVASIIEKEASLDNERADVASVLYNRLREWMPLQSDATIGYTLDHAVTADDLEIESPYNTYKNYGLPPTPICNPGLESIKAALNPNDTKYLYFLLIDDGNYQKHVFSENYDDHLKAIEEANADLH